MLAAAGAIGCGGSGGGEDTDGLSGTVRTDGSDTVGPYLLEAAMQFRDSNSGVRVTVGVSGSKGGIEKLCAGEVDVAAVSRLMTASELEGCRAHEREVVRVPIAVDALVIAESADLGVRCLSTQQLRQLWSGDGHGAPLAELGDDPGTGEPLPEVKVSLKRPGSGAGVVERLTAETGTGDADELPGDPYGDGARVAEQLGDSDGDAIGALSYSEFLDAGVGETDLISIDPGTGCVPPGQETIQDASYPLTYPLFLFVDGEAQREKPELAAFLKWLADHQTADADAVHVQPLPEDGIRRAAALLGSP